MYTVLFLDAQEELNLKLGAVNRSGGDLVILSSCDFKGIVQRILRGVNTKLK
jgi:hypothetical protein